MSELSFEPSMSTEPSSGSLADPRLTERGMQQGTKQGTERGTARETERMLAPETFAGLLAAVLEENLCADVAWVLHAEEDGRVSFVSSGGHDARRVRLWIPPRTPVVSAFETGSPVLFDDYACARFRECTASGWNGIEARSLLLVPVPSERGGHPWAIELASKRANAFAAIDFSSLPDLIADAVGRGVDLARPVPMLDACRAISALTASLSQLAGAPTPVERGPVDLAEELSHDVNNGLAVLGSNIGNLVQAVEDLVGAVTRAKTLLYMAQLAEEPGASDADLQRGVEMALEVLDGCEARELAADALEISTDAKAAVLRITSAVERVVRRDEDNPNQMPEAVRLDDEAARLTRLFSRALPRRACVISLQAPEVALPTITRPRQLVQAALLNLLQSAVSSASRPGAAGPGAVVVRAFADERTVSVSVLDDGVIEHDEQEDEDELSLAAPPRLATGPSRSGLEEAREAVEALGGSLRVERVPGMGTLVTMSVPRSVSTEGP